MIKLRTAVAITVTVLFSAFIGCTKDKTPVPVPVTNGTPCDPNKVYFERDVKPLLGSNCAMSGCHDAATQQDGVDLSSFEGVREQVKPGDPEDSDIIEMINESDPDERMPPPPRPALTNEQKMILWNWILQGADNAVCSSDSSGCNPSNVSFSGDVQPVISNNCIGCHSGSTVNGGVNLSSHGGVQAAAQSGKLYNAISQNGLATPMPPNGKLPACDIARIKAWIDEGMKNN